MDVYFFSYHPPDPEMVKDLGGSITSRFKGDISDIQRHGNKITFTENLFLGAQQIKCCHTIPAESIVVVEGPILLQEAWLKAGVAKLLIPQIEQEAGNWGVVSFKYCGLTQVHQIIVNTSKWSSGNSSIDEKAQDQALNMNEMQQPQGTEQLQMQNRPLLFRLLAWKQAQCFIFHQT